MTLDELMVRVRVVAEGSEDLDGLVADIKKFAQEAQNAKQKTEDSTQAQAMAWGAVSAAAGMAFGQITGAVSKGIEANNAYTAALNGLNSVATGKGIGSDSMSVALEKVTDQFFDASAAATAYKNLLSRGYSLDQATQTITRLKDAAAFGRQASLSLKDAVVSATEGIKNENSILVDNAGVTKNVSNMWKEYAASIGVGVQSLTQAQKIEAEYQGIMQETQLQVGDMQKLSEGMAGAQATAAMQAEQAYRTLGDAMTPVVEAGTNLGTALMTGLTEAATACPALTSGLTSAAAAMTGLTAAVAGLKALKTLFSSASLLAGALGPIAAVAGALGLAAAAYTSVTKAQKEAKAQQQENIRKNQEAARSYIDTANNLRQMSDRYLELGNKLRTPAEQNEFLQLQRDLAGALGTTTQAIETQAQSLDVWSKAIDAVNAQELDKALQAAQDASKEQMDIFVASVDKFFKSGHRKGPNFVYSEEAFEKIGTDSAAAFGTMLDVLGVEMQARGLEFSDDQRAFFEQLFTDNFFPDAETVAAAGQDGVINGLREVFEAAGDIITGGQMDALLNEQAGLIDKIMYGEMTPEEAAERATVIAAELLAAWQPFFDLMNFSTEDQVSFINKLLPIDLLEYALGGTESLTAAMAGMADEAAENAYAASELGMALKKCEKDMASLEARTSNVAKLKKYVDTWDDAYKAFKNTKKGSKEAETALEKMSSVAKKAGVAFQKTEDGVEDANKQFKQMGNAVDTETAAIASALSSLQNELISTQAQMYLDGAAGLDTSAAEAHLEELRRQIEALVAYANANGIDLASVSGSSGRGGGGGGGGGGRDESADAERAAREAERARQEAIQRDYDIIEHKRHMQEITLEEELAMIEKIRTAHRLNAEEIMEWEEKIYDLKQEIRERDAESIDTLADGVVTALENRYEAMQEAEIQRLDASREAWEQWRDDSVAAIEDQIAALDKLSETEDREAKDAEELRKIEKLRREIEYEQDDYNRMKLQQQLDKALESREERLRKLALSDQKDALHEEIDRINDKTDEQLDALDKEQEAIEKAYEERLKEAAINAEAEKLLMTKSQDELMDLLYEYVPEYNALGQTMGEKLLDGFKSKVGDVVAWFKNFNEGLYQMQEQLASMSNAAADSFYSGYEQRQDSGAAGVTVNQTVQFYEPVESPSQIARRMEDVNDALGELLGG